ncbi:unnamed protein product, partial [Rangifer tarandus platyrhynchus]
VLMAGGSLLDALSLSIVAALRTLIETEGKPFPAENVPLVVTVGQIGRHYVWDMRSSEEAACSSRLAVAVSPAGFKSVGLQALAIHLHMRTQLDAQAISACHACLCEASSVHSPLNETANQRHEGYSTGYASKATDTREYRPSNPSSIHERFASRVCPGFSHYFAAAGPLLSVVLHFTSVGQGHFKSREEQRVAADRSSRLVCGEKRSA